MASWNPWKTWKNPKFGFGQKSGFIYISENWDRTEDYFLYSCDYDRCTFYTNQDNWIKRPLYTLHYADRMTHKTFFKNKEFGGLDLVAKKPIRNCQFFALCCLKAKYKTKANLKSFLRGDVVVFDNHDDAQRRWWEYCLSKTSREN